MRNALFVSRFRQTKKEADRDAKWFRRHGGKFVSVTGSRGGPWRVRAKMPIAEFAKFCTVEAHREARQ